MADPEIPEEVKQAQSVVEAVLGDSIVGIYLFGSAFVGGLKRDSDVDILVAVSNPPTFGVVLTLSRMWLTAATGDIDVLFERNCGTTTGFSSQISLVPADADLGNEGGNIYVADGYPQGYSVKMFVDDRSH